MMRALLSLGFLLLAIPGPASAHQKSVSYSKWQLSEDGAVAQVRVRWLELTSLPEAVGAGARFDRPAVLEYLQSHLVLEGDAGPCAPRPGSEIWLPSEEGWLRVEWRVRCEQPPRRLRSALFGSLTNHVHLATVLGDVPLDVVLSPAAPTASVRAGPGATSGGGLVEYVRLGIEHIVTGWDHLAFLLLLLVVAPRVRDVAVLVTGFTVGHSVTLAAAALGLLVANDRAVEATIAASILVVALENGEMDRAPGGRFVVAAALALFVTAALAGMPAFYGVAVFTACYFGLLRRVERRDHLRWALACLFGLVHGLGFSGVLIEQELAGPALVRALFGFNVGVELGQLAIVLLVWPALRFVRGRRFGPGVVDGTAAAGAALGTCALLVRVFG